MIGERIQFYRKKKGLSQEELGARLHLSRQTVSLWEKGQTLPTIDNLLRLREIFGTTLDELTEETPADNAEEYMAILTAEELEEAYRYRLKAAYRRTLPSFFIWVITAFVFVAIKASPWIVGFVLGALFVDMSLGLMRIASERRELRVYFDEVQLKTVVYSVTENQLSAVVFKDGVEVKRVTCPLSSVENAIRYTALISFKVCGEEFFMQKRFVSEDSPLSECLK